MGFGVELWMSAAVTATALLTVSLGNGRSGFRGAL